MLANVSIVLSESEGRGPVLRGLGELNRSVASTGDSEDNGSQASEPSIWEGDIWSDLAEGSGIDGVSTPEVWDSRWL
jgi:hypothetical protein